MRIDFIAHHDIQFQACGEICSILSKKYNCKVLIGQSSEPTGAEVGVMLDHSVFQPFVNKKNYKYLIHLSHDLADIDIYSNEKKFLKYYDLMLVPGEAHVAAAKNALGRSSILPIGWPKLDSAVSAYKSFESNEKTIIYAPSFVGNREWFELLPILVGTGYKILVKNHIYYDYENGFSPPKGSEFEYQEAIKSLIDMENYLSVNNFQNVEYIDRRSNLCEIFNRAQLLITDSSSASIEFIRFGNSIETGRFPDAHLPAMPQASIYCKEIKFIPLLELKSMLCNSSQLEGLLKKVSSTRIRNDNFIYNAPIESSRYAASLIDMFIQLWTKQQYISFVSSLSFKRIFGC